MSSSKHKFSFTGRLANLTKHKAKSKGSEDLESVAKEFVYPPVNSSKREIRLLEIRMSDVADNIQCGMITTTVDDAPRYEALSYTVRNLSDSHRTNSKF
jgi:hypothetical protein